MLRSSGTSATASSSSGRERRERRSSRKLRRKRRKQKPEDFEEGSEVYSDEDEEEVDERQKAALLDTFANLYNNELLCDVHFVVGIEEEKKRIPAHRLILCARSEVFERMLCGPMREGSSDMDIEVPDMDPTSFLAVLRFVYTAKASFSPDTGTNLPCS